MLLLYHNALHRGAKAVGPAGKDEGIEGGAGKTTYFASLPVLWELDGDFHGRENFIWFWRPTDSEFPQIGRSRR